MVTLEDIKERYPEGCEVVCAWDKKSRAIVNYHYLKEDVKGDVKGDVFFFKGSDAIYLFDNFRDTYAEITKPAPESKQENKKENMIVKIKPKDTTTPIYYKDVASHFQEGQTLALLFEDGSVRNIPFIHMWYYETKQPRERTKVENEIN
jgi:hypothetical protein